MLKKMRMVVADVKDKRHEKRRQGIWKNAPEFVEGCKFCRKIREDEVIFENDHIAVVLGRQHHKGHLVVATKKHVENMFDLPEKALDSFMNDTVKIIRALDEVLKPATTNLEYLDNWDFHVHWNVYPRFKSDPDYGNPPVIPPRGSRFKEHKMTKKELSLFRKKIEGIKHLW
jgi:diadenosine tetraphosphate (Ap4A) HIT family hydrolase